MLWVTKPPTGDDVHHLTFAEEGFSTFSHYALLAAIDRDEQRVIADAIERRGEIGSLLPRARMSAMPRGAVRTSRDPGRVLSHLREMRAAVLAGHVPQRHIVIELATPTTPRHVRTALEAFATEVAGDGELGLQWSVVLGEGEVAPGR